MDNENLPEGIEALIYLIRGHKVLLDQDIAALYGVKTKALVQAVKRNIDRFPHDFSFQLSIQEFKNLRSQSVTSRWGGRRNCPYAFTEQGIAMLSSILNSPKAVKANIEIMRAFVRLRKLLISHEELSRELANLERKYDSQFASIFEAIREIMNPTQPPKSRKIGFGRENG